jgi:adenine/guanine phosphoribosyltransferase-like PRPP-binding protein
LIERTGASVAALSFLMELTFLPGREALTGRRVESLISY